MDLFRTHQTVVKTASSRHRADWMMDIEDFWFSAPRTNQNCCPIDLSNQSETVEVHSWRCWIYTSAWYLSALDLNLLFHLLPSHFSLLQTWTTRVEKKRGFKKGLKMRFPNHYLWNAKKSRNVRKRVICEWILKGWIFLSSTKRALRLRRFEGKREIRRVKKSPEQERDLKVKLPPNSFYQAPPLLWDIQQVYRFKDWEHFHNIQNHKSIISTKSSVLLRAFHWHHDYNFKFSFFTLLPLQRPRASLCVFRASLKLLQVTSFFLCKRARQVSPSRSNWKNKFKIKKLYRSTMQWPAEFN